MEEYQKCKTPLLLSGEYYDEIDDYRLERRRAVFEGFKNSGREVLSRLQILQPSVGCLARCNFCSQGAGSYMRSLDKESLVDILAGVRGAMEYFGLTKLGGDRSHRTGVVFPYLDNDIMSYHAVDEYVARMGIDLGTKTRISSIGYSRHNTALQVAHERIVNQYVEYLAAVRFSWTPYNYAWRLSGKDSRVGRDEYVADFANTIDTYLPTMETLGVGKDSFCITVRTPPCIYKTSITTSLEGNVLRIKSDIIDFSSENTDNLRGVVKYGNRLYPCTVKSMSNQDGEFFCLELIDEDDTFTVLVFPQTFHRPSGGIMDMRNPINDVRLHLVSEQSSTDVRSMAKFRILSVAENASRDGQTAFSRHVMKTIWPALDGLLASLDGTKLGSQAFLNTELVRSPGVILNQGRAYNLFYKDIASGRDMPMTPSEIEQYDSVSGSAIAKGRTWVVSFLGRDDVGLRRSQMGFKHQIGGMALSGVSGIMIREWDPVLFDNKDCDGSTLRSFFIPVDIESITQGISDSYDTYLIPGVVYKQERG